MVLPEGLAMPREPTAGQARRATLCSDTVMASAAGGFYNVRRNSGVAKTEWHSCGLFS
jgi:hypothetical protein